MAARPMFSARACPSPSGYRVQAWVWFRRSSATPQWSETPQRPTSREGVTVRGRGHGSGAVPPCFPPEHVPAQAGIACRPGFGSGAVPQRRSREDCLSTEPNPGRVPLPLPLGLHDQHLQPVLHVGKARVGVVVQGKDVCLGVQLLQTLHDAAAHHVVGQAAEGL